MKKLGNKGFSLIELLATIVLLSLIVGIAAYSVTTVINKSKEKDYQLLVKEIKNAVELYYQECKYSNGVGIDCPEAIDFMGNDSYSITLNDLVEYGYLKANGDDEDGDGILVNPIDNEYIGECSIRYMVTDGKFSFDYDDSINSSCPAVRQ